MPFWLTLIVLAGAVYAVFYTFFYHFTLWQQSVHGELVDRVAARSCARRWALFLAIQSAFLGIMGYYKLWPR